MAATSTPPNTPSSTHERGYIIAMIILIALEATANFLMVVYPALAFSYSEETGFLKVTRVHLLTFFFITVVVIATTFGQFFVMEKFIKSSPTKCKGLVFKIHIYFYAFLVLGFLVYTNICDVELNFPHLFTAVTVVSIICADCKLIITFETHINETILSAASVPNNS